MRSVLALAAALLFANPASAQAPSGAESPYGDFLAGRAAMARGDAAESAARLGRAAAALPGETTLTQQAFTAAILAGETERAAEIARTAKFDGPIAEMARLVRTADALRAPRGKVAAGLLAAEAPAPLDRAVRLLRPLAAAQAGSWDTALEPAPAFGSKTLDVVARLIRANLLEARGRHDEAAAEHAELAAQSPDTPFLMLARAAYLERLGKGVEAAAIYDAGLKIAPADPDLPKFRARALAGRERPPAPTVASTAGMALAGLGGQAFADRAPELAVFYMRLSLHLDPSQAQNRLLLGDMFDALGQKAAARETWASVPETARQRPDALFRLAVSLIQDDPDRSLALAREAAANAGPRAPLALAELLNAHERYDEAVATLRGAPMETDGRWWFALGTALERAGRWNEAEPALTKALELRPDDPEVQNYVGYSWIDRGVRLQEGMALIEKAVAAAPRSGAIQDSLGWAYYRLGDYEKAVEILELAVGLEPGNAEINDHLGDAYWKVGRRIEAEFQWRRALSLDPTPKQKTAIEAKLKGGLPPATERRPS